jgi:trehalose/maltose transport system substrate-binding protein
MVDCQSTGMSLPSAANLKHKWLLLLPILIFAVGGPGCQKSEERNSPVTISFSTLTFSQTLYHGGPDILAEFTRQTGIRVRMLCYEGDDMDARRLQHSAWLRQHASTPDVYEADIIDVGTLAEYMIDLNAYLGEDDRQHMPAIMRNLTFDGRVVALPVHTDVGLLFYRTDLLKKYGYQHPPRTWGELETMAAKIQAGERAAGHHSFWGFVWEGSPMNEGLIYTALEWQASSGGGQIIEPDGTISVNNPWAIAALRRARRWIGTISPPSVTAYQVEDLSNVWKAGRAAFMRSWPYYYSLGQAADSLSRGRFDVAALPSGGVGSVGVLGGWQLMVSKYSAHPKEAAALVRYLTSTRTQLMLARQFSYPPTRAALYDDPEVLRASPYFSWLKEEFPRLALARPSSVTGGNYLAVAEAYKKAVHSVLTREADAADAMAKLEKELVAITGFPVRHPTAPLPSSKSAPAP